MTTWLYFGLNYAFFHYPWPWATWTARTPNALVFTACAISLTLAALRSRAPTPESSCPPNANAPNGELTTKPQP